MSNIIWTVISILFLFWLIGLVMHIGGQMIHFVLVVAIVLMVVNFLSKGKATL